MKSGWRHRCSVKPAGRLRGWRTGCWSGTLSSQALRWRRGPFARIPRSAGSCRAQRGTSLCRAVAGWEYRHRRSCAGGFKPSAAQRLAYRSSQAALLPAPAEEPAGDPTLTRQREARGGTASNCLLLTTLGLLSGRRPESKNRNGPSACCSHLPALPAAGGPPVRHAWGRHALLYLAISTPNRQ
jgi:hypothetical protein